MNRVFKYLFPFFISSLGIFLSVSNKTNQPISSKIELGKKLFFDKRLSKNNKVSCATCHKPEFAFADTSSLSIGVENRMGRRNTPSAMNMASREFFFFDGRAKTLEEQATFPIQDHNEMDILLEKAFDKIKTDVQYQKAFKKLYGKAPNKTNILHAIAEFERSLESTGSFDKYMAGDENAISASAKRGHQLFLDPKNKCFDCHFTPDFTADEFRNIGLFDGKKYKDSGRYLITRNPQDIGKFKVPGLRNVAVTAPYMHDGSMRTLREVINFYNNIYILVPHPINEDSLVKSQLNLSEEDITDIENFLISLTDPKYKHLLYAKNSLNRRGRKSPNPTKKD